MTQPPRTPLEIVADARRMEQVMDDKTPLTPTRRRKIIADLEELRAAEGVTARAMAQNIGCARSTLTQILGGSYPGDADRYLRQAVAWLADRADRAVSPVTPYVRTGIGDAVMAVCRRAADGPCIGRIVTPSGTGKTAALREFARRRGDRAIYVQAGVAYRSTGGLLGEIARHLNVRGHHRGPAALHTEIRDVLAGYYAEGRGDPFVLLIDEATTLLPAALNALRNLHDDAACRAAVVLADTGRLAVELSGRNGAMYEQLRSRCGAVYLMTIDEEVPADDVRAVAEAVISELGSRRKIGVRALRYLTALAQRDGKLRNVVYRLQAVAYIAGQTQTTATWSVAQLDFAADLVGDTHQMSHAAIPFGDGSADVPAEPAGRTDAA